MLIPRARVGNGEINNQQGAWSRVGYKISYPTILGDPGAASWGDGIFTGESLQQERESPWAFTLTERVPEAFEIPLADWPEKFSGQSEGGI